MKNFPKKKSRKQGTTNEWFEKRKNNKNPFP
jgi:hypothetical protein